MKTIMHFITQDLSLGEASTTLLGLLCALGFWLFPLTTAFAQHSIQRDQQALAILKQTIAASGGQELLTSIRDCTETGTVTYNWGDQATASVMVKSRGLHQLRIDAELAAGKRTTVANGDGGSLREADGRTSPIYRQSAADLGSFTLPYIPLIAAVQDSSTGISYGGLVTREGTMVHDIRLQLAFNKPQDPSGNRGVREVRDFFIDSKTLLVTAVADRIYSGRGGNDLGVPHEILYSNYQAKSGMLAPLTIVETVRGVIGFTMNLSEVVFNSGLADSDFSW